MASNSAPRILTFPRGDLASARLVFASGVAPRLHVRGSALGETLARCEFGEPAPHVEHRGDEITIDYRGFWRWFFSGRSTPSTINLNDALPWAIEVDGGVANVDLDLRTLQVTRFEVDGGAAKVDMRLGKPKGMVPIRLSGGAARLRITHPPGIASRLRVTGGAAQVDFGQQSFGAVGGGLTLTSPGWSEKADGYDIKIGGGAARLSVEEEGSS